MVWEPLYATFLYEINDHLRGVVPFNLIDNLDPENFYFVK